MTARKWVRSWWSWCSHLWIWRACWMPLPSRLIHLTWWFGLLLWKPLCRLQPQLFVPEMAHVWWRQCGGGGATFETVIQKCVRRTYQPSILFYEASLWWSFAYDDAFTRNWNIAVSITSSLVLLVCSWSPLSYAWAHRKPVCWTVAFSSSRWHSSSVPHLLRHERACEVLLVGHDQHHRVFKLWCALSTSRSQLHALYIGLCQTT